LLELLLLCYLQYSDVHRGRVENILRKMAILAAFIPDLLGGVSHARRFQSAIRLCVALLVLGSAEDIARAQTPKPVLISETTNTRAIALEPTELKIQPFSPTSNTLFYGTDQRTRIMLFVANLALQPGESLSAVTAEAEDGTHRRYELGVEALRPVPGQEWISQITLRLHDQIGDVGDVRVGVVYRGVASNRVLVGIGHFGGGLPDAPGEVPTPATVYSVSGRIAESNNNALANVPVTVSDGATNRTVTTNAAGVYSIALTAYGHYTFTPSVRFFNIAPQTLSLDFLNANQPAANFTATRQLHTIGGQVKDDQGNAVVGLPVTLRSSANGSSPKVINTGSGGFFSFTDVPAGFSYTITPSTTNIFAFTTQETGVLDGNLSLDFNGTRHKYTISGFVKNGQEGVGGILLTLAGGNNPNPLTTTTDSGGQFSFTNVAAGYDYTLTPTSTAYYNFSPQSLQTFQNLSGNQTVTINGTMHSYKVSGLVTDENNNPLSGSIMLLYTGNLSISRSAVTGSDGRYEFADVPAAYSYTVGPQSNPKYSFTNQSINGLPADLTLNFNGIRNTYTISGVVKDRSNQPVSGASVTLSGAANSSVLTDADGRYSFSNLTSALDYNLLVAKTDYIFEPPTRPYFLLRNEQADFTAIRTYKISGRVTNMGGLGIAGATMTLSGPETGKALTASDGSYSFVVTTVGNYLLTPSKEQNFYTFAPASQSLSNLNAHQTVNFTAAFSSSSNPSYVLEFNGSPGTVDYGLFWPEGPGLGHFFWEFWAMPAEDSHTRYLVSDGYGGAHALLFGFNYGAEGNYNLFGNIWDGSKATFYYSDEGPAPGEWGHFAVGWDGKNLITYYNGVPVGKQPFTGPRISPGRSWGASLLLIGGSDHQNVRGRIAQVRGYEDNNPRESSPESTFAPQTVFSPEGQLLSYYFRPAQTVADLSAGYNAGTHAGTLRGIDFGYTIDCPDCPKPKFVIDPTAPNFSNPANPGQINAPVTSPPATPPGARVFDSFSRNNSTFILGGAGGLGSTESGSAGAQVWKTNINASQAQPFGILSGRAVLLRSETAVAWVSTGAGAGNLEVRVNRTAGQNGSGDNTGLSFRVTDRNNYFFAYTSNDQDDPAKPKKLSLGYYQAGVRTILASGIVMPSLTWKTLRVVTTQAGGINVYADNAQVYATTSLVFASATGAGLFNNAPGLSLTNRWDNFTVLNAP
jgi:Carboxypeptidase regulatory-like domain/Concanavalin A-like lectin/glucanases superfamily